VPNEEQQMANKGVVGKGKEEPIVTVVPRKVKFPKSVITGVDKDASFNLK
jgi:hypothetical protein